jgi:hypothetical protein
MTPEQFFALLGEPDLEVRKPVDLWFVDEVPDVTPPIVYFVTRGGQKVVFRPRKEEQNETAAAATLAPLAA